MKFGRKYVTMNLNGCTDIIEGIETLIKAVERLQAIHRKLTGSTYFPFI